MPSVRRLLPTPSDVETTIRRTTAAGAEGDSPGHTADIVDVEANVAAEARPAPPDRPWVMVNMVTSVDGASSGPNGRSAPLSSDADRRLFHALRSVADVVLAGAGTVRAENYGAPRPPRGGATPAGSTAAGAGSPAAGPAGRPAAGTTGDATPGSTGSGGEGVDAAAPPVAGTTGTGTGATGAPAGATEHGDSGAGAGGTPVAAGKIPRLATVSASLALDPDARFFREPDVPPIVLTTEQALAEGRADPRLAAVAEVRATGHRELDWPAALALLRREYDCEVLLVEGGATLNTQLVALDLIDELRLTISPVVVGGASSRVVAPGAPAEIRRYTLADLVEDDGFLFLRYLRHRH